MHNVALRQLLIKQRMEELERDALRLKLGQSLEGLSRSARVAQAVKAAASAYRSSASEPDPAGATCLAGDEKGVLVWADTTEGERVLTCRIAA